MFHYLLGIKWVKNSSYAASKIFLKIIVSNFFVSNSLKDFSWDAFLCFERKSYYQYTVYLKKKVLYFFLKWARSFPELSVIIPWLSSTAFIVLEFIANLNHHQQHEKSCPSPKKEKTRGNHPSFTPSLLPLLWFNPESWSMYRGTTDPAKEM